MFRRRDGHLCWVAPERMAIRDFHRIVSSAQQSRLEASFCRVTARLNRRASARTLVWPLSDVVARRRVLADPHLALPAPRDRAPDLLRGLPNHLRKVAALSPL